MDWIGHWKALMIEVMNFRFARNCGRFLGSCATGGFPSSHLFYLTGTRCQQ
jgi:glutamine amidotransferase-like uncharacterized protein